MKKLIFTALALSIGIVGFSQTKEEKPKGEADTTMTNKANYNTTRSNKKSIAAPDDKTVKKEKKTVTKSGGGNSLVPNIHTIIDRKKMR